MTTWIISANHNMYDHKAAFNEWDFIDWRQHNYKYSVGDIVYIYSTSPYKRINYKTKVIKVNQTSDEIVNDAHYWVDKEEFEKSLDGDYIRLQLIEKVDLDELSLDYLLNNGLNAAPQGHQKVSKELEKYIESYMDEFKSPGIFPESEETSLLTEGAKTTVTVNKYERSSFARAQCLEHHGYNCKVCDLLFTDMYGEVGKKFIHVHHIVPISEIDEEYKIDPIKDLVPICPNCHAMLHRKINGKYLSIDELKSMIKL